MTTRVSFRKMDKGGQKNTYRKIRGGGEVTVGDSTPSRGVGGMPPRKFFNFRPSETASGTFSDHLCFSNDMTR